MPVPPPLPDPANIELRLEIVATMLERAVEEVKKAMIEIKGGGMPAAETPKDGQR